MIDLAVGSGENLLVGAGGSEGHSAERRRLTLRISSRTIRASATGAAITVAAASAKLSRKDWQQLPRTFLIVFMFRPSLVKKTVALLRIQSSAECRIRNAR